MVRAIEALREAALPFAADPRGVWRSAGEYDYKAAYIRLGNAADALAVAVDALLALNPAAVLADLQRERDQMLSHPTASPDEEAKRLREENLV